jgi:hypothetical protein
MWTEGYHCKPDSKFPRTNERLKKIEGTITTKEAQVAFAQFCQANPSFTAQLLLGMDLYPFQDLFIRAMFQKDFFLGICARGLGKCQHYSKDSKVITKENGLISLVDLLPDLEFQDEEYTLDIPETQLWNGKGYQPVKRVLVQKGLKGFDVKTRMGFSVSGSVRHRVKVMNSTGSIVWKRYDELDKENDYICVSTNKTPEISGGVLENVESYIVGLILGDGTISPNERQPYFIGFSSADEYLLNYLEPFCGKRVPDKRSKTIHLNFKKEFSEALIKKI